MNRLYDIILNRIEKEGEKKVILDLCYNKQFCELNNINYCDDDVYTQIKTKLHIYKSIKDYQNDRK